MTTEDLQGQVARSAAVERELREKIAQLQHQVEEAKSAAARICYQGGTAAGEVLAKMQAETTRLREELAEARRHAREYRELYEEAEPRLRAGDLVQTIDGLCDVIYVALGCAVECGIDLAPFFAEVHRSNMQKAGGPRRADGKILKPPGWTPPDIAGLLR